MRVSERNFDDFEQSLGIFRQISRDPLGVGWDAACWQAGERHASLSIDNILLSERLSKYWKNVCQMPSHGGSLVAYLSLELGARVFCCDP